MQAEVDRLEEACRVALSLDERATPDQLIRLIDRRDVLKQRLKELCDRVDQLLLDWCTANGALEVGPVRYYVGVESVTRCTDAKAVLTELLGLTDIETIAGCLSTNAWKHGTVKGTLAELGAEAKYAELFTVEQRVDLKTGKPLKKVQRIDTTFVR